MVGGGRRNQSKSTDYGQQPSHNKRSHVAAVLWRGPREDGDRDDEQGFCRPTLAQESDQGSESGPQLRAVPVAAA